MKSNAAVLFSGGIDSTYLTEKIAPKYDRINLVTFIVPGLFNLDKCRNTFKQIKKRHKNTRHDILDIRDFIHKTRGGITACLKDNLRFGFFYSWCLGCKLCMHLSMIRYCQKNSIPVVLDGSNAYDKHALEQYIYVKEIFKKLYDEAGISYLTPFYKEKQIIIKKGLTIEILKHLTLYKDATEYKADYLEKKGYRLGKRLGSQFRDIQPSCYISPIFNAVRIPYKAVFSEDEKSVSSYLQYKIKCTRKLQ